MADEKKKKNGAAKGPAPGSSDAPPEAKAKEPEAKAKEPEAKAKEPEAKAKEPEAKAKEPEAKAKEPEAKAKEPEAKAKEPKAKAKEPEANAKEPEAKAKESEAKESEAKAKEPEAKAKDAKEAPTDDDDADDDEAPASKPTKSDRSKGKPSSPWPSSHKGDEPAAAAKDTKTESAKTADAKAVAPAEDDGAWPKAKWGEPLLRFDKAWTRLEARMCWWVVILEVVTLCIAILLAGLSSSSAGAAKNGIVLRCLLTSTALGIAAHFATRKQKHHTIVVTSAVIVGLLLGPLWASKGVVYFGNMRGWVQSASFLALFGGISNLAKRLTIWLALLGASVAAAQGKHINVDVVMRFLTPRWRVPVALVGWLAAAIVSFAAVWGFFDQIAIESFRIPDSRACADDPTRACRVPVGERIEHMGKDIRRDGFLAGRQLSLDLRSLPKVAAGEKFDAYMTPAEWNAWVKESNFTRYFPEQDVKGIYAPEGSDIPRSPLIVIPGAVENVQDLLVRELSLIFPFGFFMIGLRFLLRALLALAGQVKVDPNAAHADDEDRPAVPEGGAQ